MIFDRYRNKSKSTTISTFEKTKSSLANSFFKRFPNFTSNKKKNVQLQNATAINQPRTSVSLPNIKATIKPTTTAEPVIPKRKTNTIKQRKRHSAEQRRRRHHLISIQDANRHSFTFGHLPSQSTNNRRLSKADLRLDPEQLAKLDKVMNSQDNTLELLAKLGSSHPPILVPHRSISHQQLTVPQIQRQPLSRAHSESHAKTVEREADPLEPEELAELLRAEQEGVGNSLILIDVRNLMEYQKRRIRGSLNVNLPSLLIKRYQRGTVSNFNLENFITTFEGREIYSNKKVKKTPNTFTTILEQKAVEAEQKARKRKSLIWVVYDQDMSEDDQTSQAWTLLNVLERVIGSDKKNEGKVHYLCGGFQTFSDQFGDWLESSQMNLTSLPNPSTSSLSAGTLKLNNNIPRRSISYTMGESRNEKRTSLFSLDTQAARVNNANALARRAKRRSQQITDNKSSSHLPLIQQPPEKEEECKDQNNNRSGSQTTLNQLKEDDETMAEEISPRTETDYTFTISEIIPSFLYVGPEIETQEQAEQLLQHRQIKRVLNMAEECEDEGLSKHTIIYHKISARDTLEMKNIELVMMEAVQFIGKKNATFINIV